MRDGSRMNRKNCAALLAVCLLSAACCRLFGILETVLGAVTANVVYRSAAAKYPGKRRAVFAACAAGLAAAFVSAVIFTVLIRKAGGAW